MPQRQPGIRGRRMRAMAVKTIQPSSLRCRCFHDDLGAQRKLREQVQAFAADVKKAAPYETDLLGDTYCSVEIESNAKLILAWHLGRRSAHDTRLFVEKLRAPRFSQAEQPAWVFELAFSMNSHHDFGASRRSQ